MTCGCATCVLVATGVVPEDNSPRRLRLSIPLAESHISIQMVHITEEQVRKILPVTKAIELLETCFRRLAVRQATNHPRRRIKMRNGTLLHYMAAADNESEYMGAKIYVTSPRGGAHFLVTLFDASTTSLLATIDADSLGQIRTGAASGLATKFMANVGAQTLGIIGTGWQAETQLSAIAAVRPLEKVKVYSRSDKGRNDFAEKMSDQHGIEIEPVLTAQDAVSSSEIVTTVTNSKTSVVRGAWLRPGTHINAVGSNHFSRCELDVDVVKAAELVVADSVEQAKIEAGDLMRAYEKRVLDWEQVQELSAIVNGTTSSRDSPNAITLFESQGLAIEDIAVAGYVYENLR